ncbi:hypothetical protein WQ54_04050 [Bacillus sp. SA1-12]|nr:hypothetical protein WQ54_04050 [Bacillus sp. SA1-12]
MRKRKHPFVWIGIALAGLYFLSIIVNMIGHFLTTRVILQSHMGHGPGSFTFQHAGVGGHFDFINVPFLFSIGLIAFGWWIWKKADGEPVKKWLGGILLAAVFSILPLVIAIPALLLALYIAFKSKKADSDLNDEPMSVITQAYTNHDLLDEWERKTNREEQK